MREFTNALARIINTCLGSTKAQLAACAATDWDCLCTQQTNVLTCYNNCPADPNAFGAQQTETSYCNAAKAYGSSSSSVSTSATASVSSSLASALASQSSAIGSATMGSSSASATRSMMSSSSTASSTGSAASASSSSGANALLLPAGGVLAAIFGFAAVL